MSVFSIGVSLLLSSDNFNFCPIFNDELVKLFSLIIVSIGTDVFLDIEYRVSPFFTVYVLVVLSCPGGVYSTPKYSAIAFTTPSAKSVKLFSNLFASFLLSINPYSINTLSAFPVSLII